MNEEIISSKNPPETRILVPDVSLKDGAKLYRFTMANGTECSSIWKDGEEMWWHYRDREQSMVEDWNRFHD